MWTLQVFIFTLGFTQVFSCWYQVLQAKLHTCTKYIWETASCCLVQVFPLDRFVFKVHLHNLNLKTKLYLFVSYAIGILSILLAFMYIFIFQLNKMMKALTIKKPLMLIVETSNNTVAYIAFPKVCFHLNSDVWSFLIRKQVLFIRSVSKLLYPKLARFLSSLSLDSAIYHFLG